MAPAFLAPIEGFYDSIYAVYGDGSPSGNFSQHFFAPPETSPAPGDSTCFRGPGPDRDADRLLAAGEESGSLIAQLYAQTARRSRCREKRTRQGRRACRPAPSTSMTMARWPARSPWTPQPGRPRWPPRPSAPA